MDTVVSTYVAYLTICVPVVLFVGWTLFKNGRLFLVEIFEGNEELAKSINYLLIVGFYLAGLGFVSMMLRLGPEPTDTADSIEGLSTLIGAVLMVLGVAHLANMFLLSSARRQVLLDKMTPPPPGWDG
jgi:uncharacterized membrane protein HdeD (DUF308 family)